MRISLISSPFWLDALEVNIGQAPRALLDAGLVAALEADGHSVIVVDRELELGPGSMIERVARNGAILAQAIVGSLDSGRLPVVLGGDCIVSVGVCAGLRRILSQDFGVVWFDTHGDFNTPETTISGYLGGMPLACICGRGLPDLRRAAGLDEPIDDSKVVILGTRDLDPMEADMIAASGLRIFPPRTVSRYRADRQPTYLHIDIDAIDPMYAPGVNHPTPGGLSPSEAIEAASQIQPYLVAFSLSAVNPDRDPDGKTLQTAIGLIRAIVPPADTRSVMVGRAQSRYPRTSTE